jgi:hypothetical protein
MPQKKITTPIKPPEISSITHEENEEIQVIQIGEPT